MKRPNIYIHTWGCQMNIADSDQMKEILTKNGYNIINAPHQADVIILNTCSVRDKAEEKVYGKLGDFIQIKKKNPDLIIGLGGCMGQSLQKRILDKFDALDFVFGTYQTNKIYDILTKIKKSRSDNIFVEEKNTKTDIIKSYNSDNLKANLNIMYGCNNFCTYCIVPYVRGPEISRSHDIIKQEFQVLLNNGYKDITLLGQNVNSYGLGTKGEMSFPELLYMLANIDGQYRIRFTTSHPKDFSKELIDVIKNNPKICKHIHLPIQSGSDNILKSMNRKYTQKDYLDIINNIRDNIPDCSITTDIIVGFPGETEDDFLETYKVMKIVKYDSAFMFKYSIRRNTAAASIKPDVPENDKNERLQKILKLQEKIAFEKNNKLVGTVQEVLVEGNSPKDDKFLTGRTDGNKVVIFPHKKGLESEFVSVKITDSKSYTLYGKITD